MIQIHKVPSPCYVMEEDLLRKNLTLIKSVKDRTGVDIILAFKAFALWKSFPIIKEYIPHSTASSVFEAQLAYEGSRFGATADLLGDTLPEGLDGIHFHTLCESSSYDLEKTLEVIESKFDKLLRQAKWLNMGGGHLMTRADYDVEHLVALLQKLSAKYPHLKIVMEPGSAFAWQTGVLVSTVVDIVENRGIKTAILDVSFACHMPDCLEMPYKPRIRGAYHEPESGKPTYRMGGSSCLSGDFMGDWSFDEPLAIGDKIVFEDMIHYTIVKTTMFNGVSHPAIALWTKEEKLEIYREFEYNDYKNRMS